jgi:hypothetical protein
MSGSTRFRKRGIGGVEDRRRRPAARGTNPVDVLLGRTAPSHLPTARSVLNRMATYFSDGRLDARSFPWHELTYAQVAELRTMLGRQYAPRTANNYLSTLKGVLREAKRLGLLDAASFDLLCDQPPVRGETLPAGRHVEADELELLFKYLGTLETASGARDRATFALLRGTGIPTSRGCQPGPGRLPAVPFPAHRGARQGPQGARGVPARLGHLRGGRLAELARARAWGAAVPRR